jgi:hypothetical protein
MNLKHAKAKNKLEHFITEKEKTHPRASHRHFHGAIKSMIGGTVKPKRGTSKRVSRGS